MPRIYAKRVYIRSGHALSTAHVQHHIYIRSGHAICTAHVQNVGPSNFFVSRF